jgi:hypothetical protein
MATLIGIVSKSSVRYSRWRATARVVSLVEGDQLFAGDQLLPGSKAQ